MDTNGTPEITFDKDGVCNYCTYHFERVKLIPNYQHDAQKLLSDKIEQIKRAGAGKEHDCILGLSGGTDSTYMVLQAKKFGLRPLLVHFDNGWNSELAIKNIENVLKKLNLDLFTYVVNWDEFRDLQLAYIKASVIDIEAITDHAIVAVLYKTAIKHTIKYILSGENTLTESIIPSTWVHVKSDHLNILSIHKKFGKIPLKTFPLMTFRDKAKIRTANVEVVKLLDYVSYNKDEAKQAIISELGWKDYGGKHYESIFTRFYQGYILSTKFGVDKRKGHLSNLICAGQISREDALAELKKPAYDPELLKIDMEFVHKKLGLTPEEFQEIMTQPVRSHKNFLYVGPLYNRYRFLQPLKPLWDRLKASFPGITALRSRLRL
jgi:N-acetyl sugar amidotransferase